LGDDDGGHATPPNQHAADSTTGTNIADAVQQAQALRLKGDLPGATHILSQLMLASPDDSRIVGEYGKLLLQQGEFSDAVQFLNRAVQLQPSDWTYYSALGVAYDQLGDRNNAKLAYEHGLALKPNEPALLNNYAMSRMLAGDTVNARALMARAQASGSTDPKIAANLELLNGMAPHTATAPATAPRNAVAAGFPPAAKPAQAAPLPLSQGSTRVVMQQVPTDPMAGPVRHSGKPAKAVALNGTKPDKKAKPTTKDHIPSLRMTADAGKP
jgi:Flp pilus assembly protein TadD